MDDVLAQSGLFQGLSEEAVTPVISRLETITLPRAILCGHVHEDHGVCVLPGTEILVSQAATTVHSLALGPR